MTYYLLAPRKYDLKLEDEITNLDIKLFPDGGATIMSWPISVKQSSNYGFLEKLIWKRGKK